ncbi:DEAD/DEAH box helicase [Aestuariimicrobium ganziense]|uniref:DEAD/DEAH box helicase n=1 Tax=Aestuariimicrobium ganziense TaxID=2773677 RepID=UPI001941EE8A|nr:DEAD/DEAH box helicase [Aestuariimicrobium ganziense]
MTLSEHTVSHDEVEQTSPTTSQAEPASPRSAPEADERLSFADLGVIAPIEQSLAEVGITHPFPIQSLAIPIAIEGTDMIGQARTGTGKTLAFGISLLQRIVVAGDAHEDEWAHPGKPQALVMCPTRELALQVARDLEIASSVRKARVLTVYGGVGYEPQLDALAAGVDVVVGTPGRLLDLANRGTLDLRHVKVVVLDEADEMLDLGFLPDVERLIGKTPTDRQTLLFSATMPSAIVSLARAHLRRPVNVRAEGHDAQATVPDTTQFVYQAHDLDKPEIIGRVLQADGVEKVMVFCKTKRAAQRLSDELEDRGFAAASIHGDLNQAARERALKRFRDGKIAVLVATDVAARGIDVSGVSHVINNECPDDEKTYVHRIGRTGRAGAKGVAITLVDWADLTRWKLINKALELDFEDPAETYSTSPHLYTDLEIPEGTKGRLVSAGDAERARSERSERDGHRSDRGGRSGRGDRGPRRDRDERRRDDHAQGEHAAADRPRRQRRRTRNGEVLDQAQAPSSEQQTSTAGTSEGSDVGQSSRRRRRRRGGRGGGQPGSDQTRPNQTSPNQPSPNQTSPNQTSPNQTSTDQTSTDQ